LRGAVFRANQTVEHDEIWLGPLTYTLSVGATDEDLNAGGDLDILYDLTIHGSTAGGTTIDANGIDRVLDVHDGVTFTIEAVTVQGGYLDGFNGGGIRMYAEDSTLIVERCTVQGNSANAGGGIVSTGSVEIRASTITNNVAEGRGGGIYSLGSLDLVDSQLSLNDAANGGGIYNSGNPVHLQRCAIFGNAVTADGAGVYNGNGMSLTNCSLYLNFASSGSGGAIRNDHYLVITHVTITGNVAAGNTSSAIFNDSESYLYLAGSILQGTCATSLERVSSHGGNLESPGDSCGLTHSTDQTDVSDPMLGTVDFHGGLTRTWSLDPGSPAIDAVGSFDAAQDQRGWPRPVDGDGSTTAEADAGAYEYNPAGIFFDGFESGGTDKWSS
jgi:predicted outer membrane repeat protein